MISASVRGRYDTDKGGAIGTLSVNGGDVKFRATMTDATFANGPSLTDLSLSLEKPNSFLIDYNVPDKDVRFQFMNTVNVLKKPLSMTYSHWRGENRMALDGTLVIDPANKLSGSYTFGCGNCKLKYFYVHKGSTTFEPCYDSTKNSWDLAVSHKVSMGDMLRASYETTNKVLALEWSRNSNLDGSFKITASVDLKEESKIPRLSAESIWSFDL